MKIGYKFSFNAAMYNKQYAKNMVDAKTCNVTLQAEVAESFNASTIKLQVDKFVKFANGAVFARVDDPIMIDLLEPKAGATVHTRLNELKRSLTDTHNVEVIGRTIPSETKNGVTVFVMGTKYNVTLEGLALYMLDYFALENVAKQTVTIEAGNIIVSVDNDDIAEDA